MGNEKPGEGLNALQADLAIGSYMRGFQAVEAKFRLCGVSFLTELYNHILASELSQPYRLFEGAAGSTIAVQELGAILNLQEELRHDIETIALDQNPQPQLVPEELQRARKKMSDVGLGAETEVIKGDLCDMKEVPDGSVNFGFIVHGLEYVHDSLAALTEGHRILAEGGQMWWYVPNEIFISVLPSIEHIIGRTPGGPQTFQYLKETRWMSAAGVVVCTKSSEAGFKGFPYKLIFSIKNWLRIKRYSRHQRIRRYAHKDMLRFTMFGE